MSLEDYLLEGGKVRLDAFRVLICLIEHELVEALGHFRLAREALVEERVGIGGLPYEVFKCLLKLSELLLAIEDRLEATVSPRLQLLLLVVDIHECHWLCCSLIPCLGPIKKHTGCDLLIECIRVECFNCSFKLVVYGFTL